MTDLTVYARQADLEKLEFKVEAFAEKLSNALITQALIEQMQNNICSKLENIEKLIAEMNKNRYRSEKEVEDRLKKLEESVKDRKTRLDTVRILLGGTLTLTAFLSAIHIWKIIKIFINQ